MKEIQDVTELVALAEELGVREDWNEPDEQNVTAHTSGDVFDNAGLYGEIMVKFYKDDVPVAQVNLASLCAWATQWGQTVRDIEDGMAPNL